jgi:prepilin-type N-terminal cleavage/methylation domain-containing protein
MVQTGRRGFTLVEAMMVVSIIAVVAATAGPRLSEALRRRTTASAADQFVLTHSLARSAAIRYGRVAQLHVDAAGGRFWVDVDTSANGIGQRGTVAYVRDVNGDGLSMSSTRSLLCFDARGLASILGTCEPGDAKVIFTDGDRADTVTTTLLGKVLR